MFNGLRKTNTVLLLAVGCAVIYLISFYHLKSGVQENIVKQLGVWNSEISAQYLIKKDEDFLNKIIQQIKLTEPTVSNISWDKNQSGQHSRFLYIAYPISFNLITIGELGVQIDVVKLAYRTLYSSFFVICILIFSSLIWILYTREQRGRHRQSILESSIEFQKRINLLSRRVAHDIRAPLQALSLAADAYQENPDQAQSLIKRSTQRINQIANDLLIESNTSSCVDIKSFGLEGLDFNPLLQEFQIRYPQVEFKCTKQGNFSRESSSVQDLDMSGMYRAMSNLVQNAVDAIFKKSAINNPKVTVSTIFSKTSCSIVVEDNGCGIMPEHQTMILNGDVSIDKKNGNGIGLKSCVEFFSKMKANFQIQSQYGVGTKIIIQIPTR